MLILDDIQQSTFQDRYYISSMNMPTMAMCCEELPRVRNLGLLEKVAANDVCCDESK
jgi:hypothetical protein